MPQPLALALEAETIDALPALGLVNDEEVKQEAVAQQNSLIEKEKMAAKQ